MVTSYVTTAQSRASQHDGTEHLAINNSLARRFLTRLALHTTAKLYSSDGHCLPISKHKIVKTGFRPHLTEGATMKSWPKTPVFLSHEYTAHSYTRREPLSLWSGYKARNYRGLGEG
jgi:hypothetical protein